MRLHEEAATGEACHYATGQVCRDQEDLAIPRLNAQPYLDLCSWEAQVRTREGKQRTCVRKPPQAMRATVRPARSVVIRKALPVLLTVSIRAEVSSFFASCMSSKHA